MVVGEDSQGEDLEAAAGKIRVGFVVKIANFCSVRLFAHSDVHLSTPHSSKSLKLQKFINFSSQIVPSL